MTASDLKRRLTERMEERPVEFVGTGSTLVNLACTGHPRRGFAKGLYYRLVGDSVSGKSFVAYSILAEASINPKFDDYRLVYDNAEASPPMNIKKLFGTKLAERMEAPGTEDGEGVSSCFVEDFYYHVDDILKEGPCIYVLDSMDVLETKADQKKFDQHKKANRNQVEAAGSFGTAKAKMNSTHLRALMPRLKKTGSILIIISQTRDNIGFGAQMSPKVSAGGRALKFYATFEMWMKPIKRLKKSVKKAGKEVKVQQGIVAQIDIKKNKITGRERTAIIPIYHSYGIDDVGSCIDYLADLHWKKSKASIVAEEFDFQGSRNKLIEYLEENDKVRELQGIVAKVWREFEKAGQLEGRKKRYE